MKTILQFKITVLLFCIFYFGFDLNASENERIIVLHEQIGDTVDLTEKQMFYLFSSLNIKEFKWGVIKEINNNLFLNFNSSSSIKTLEIDSSVINQCRNNIAKLMAYQKEQQRVDSIKNSVGLNLEYNIESAQIKNDLINSREKNDIIYESNRYRALNSTANRLGMSGVDKDFFIQTSGVIQSKNKKKKKKKK